ncbi:MAG: DUF4956 domain-containing protein [bacterium]|nr:DUF4956 domain-containing protein [bacterium]
MDLTKWMTTLGDLGGRQFKDVGLTPLLMVMLISLLCSFFLSFLYTRFYKAQATGSQIHRAFPLLGVSVTAIFICIQFSLPLSLGLLGALSIVRFRTPIKEPEEIGFIMVVVAQSISIATFNLGFLGIILAVTVLALVILNWKGGLLKRRLNDGMFIIALPTPQYQKVNGKILELLEKKLPGGQLDSVSERPDEATISYSFTRMEKETLLELQRQLKEISADASSNVFFNRPGSV